MADIIIDVKILCASNNELQDQPFAFSGGDLVSPEVCYSENLGVVLCVVGDCFRGAWRNCLYGAWQEHFGMFAM